jgi:hypothetical protein
LLCSCGGASPVPGFMVKKKCLDIIIPQQSISSIRSQFELLKLDEDDEEDDQADDSQKKPKRKKKKVQKKSNAANFSSFRNKSYGEKGAKKENQ